MKRCLATINCALFLLFATTSAALAASGPVVQYSFDEGTGTVANDSSGNGNNGTLINGPVWITGVHGGALSFDGVNDYISDAGFSWPTGGPVTVAFWNYVDASQVQVATLFGVGAGDPNRFQVNAPYSDQILYWDYGDSTGNGRITANYAPYLGNWTHITLVSAGVGGNFKAIYFNGQLAASATVSDGPKIAISNLQVGHTPQDAVGFRHQKGSVDDFRIYNRVLTANEIQTLALLPAPTAAGDLYAVMSNQTFNAAAPGVLANDSQIGGGALTAAIDTTVTYGSLALNANGSFTYTPLAGYLGPDSFTYHAVNAQNESSGVVTVQIQVTNKPTGLAAYYTLDESSGTVAHDLSGYGRDATLANGPSWTTGIIGGALSFNGVNTYAIASTSPNLSGTDFTLAAWVYPQSANNNVILAKWDDGGAKHQFDLFIDNTGKFDLAVKNGNGSDVIFVCPTPVTTGSWYHIAVTVNVNAKQAAMYVNGSLQTTNQPVWDGTMQNAAMPMYIGGNQQGSYWSGKIDDARVYGRALTAGEISALAHPTVFLYALDDNSSGNQIYGFSENDLTGALTPLSGFPMSSGGTGDQIALSKRLVIDRANARLYVLNRGSNPTVTAFSINPVTGALSALPFSPINIGAGSWSSVDVQPTGSPLVVGAGTLTSGQLNSYQITSSTAIPATGSPYTFNSFGIYLTNFSSNGSYIYGGGNGGTSIAGFSVDSASGLLTPLAGSPFTLGGTESYVTDSVGRLYLTNFSGSINVYTTSNGIPSAVTGNPFSAPAGDQIYALMHPNGFLMVADRVNNRVGVYQITGTGSSTALSAVAGSPFLTGGTYTDILSLNLNGTFLFAANSNTRNLTTFSVNPSTGVLSAPTTQAANALGTAGTITGLAIFPQVLGSTAVTVAASNASASYSGAQAISLGATVMSSASVNEGTVTIQIMNGATPVGSAVTANVVNSASSVNYTLPAGTPPGSYTIAVSYSGGLTYSSGSDNAHTLTINKAVLTVTANSSSRAYGAANPGFSGTISGIKNGDNITATYATSAGAASIVGSYSIVPTVSDPGSKLGNYTLTVNNGSLSVMAAPLTVTALNATRAYGAANPSFSGTISGIQNNDNITATYSTSATVLSAVNSYAIIPTLVDPGSKLSNYNVTVTNGNLSITKAPLSAAAFNASRSYGAANPTFSGVLSGVLNGDNILATYDTAATPATAIGAYPIVPSLLDPDSKLGNYTANLSNGTLTIGKATLTVAADNQSRIYGAANPTFTGVIAGVQNSDNITATYATSAMATTPVGNYNIVPNLLDPTSKLGNYSLTVTNGTLAIGKAPLVVTPANVNKIYGDANPALTGTVSGVQNSENITATYSTTATAGSNVGAYAITATLNDPNNALPNYALTNNSGTLTVSKAPLTVSVDSATHVYGAPNPTFTGALSGVVNGDTISASYVSNATAASAAGPYPITASLSDPGNKLGNYALNETDGVLTITAANLSVAADNAARVYGAPNPAFTGTLSGVVNGDNITATYNSAATATTVVGTYSITAALSDPGSKLVNYTLSRTDGQLTIQQATPALAWPAPARIFAGVPLDSTQLSASAADSNLNAPIPGTFPYTPAAGTVLAPGLAQTLSVNFTPNDAVDYTAASAQTTLDVDPAIPPAITSALSASTSLNAPFTYSITSDGSAPLMFGASGLPAGLALNGADIGGQPTASGVFNVTLMATNYGGSDSKILKLIVLGGNINHAPVIASLPTVSSNPAIVGDPLSFSAQANDADGDALDYAWDFGDGTVADGPSVSKIFATPGVYIVTVIVSDGQASATQSVDLVVKAQAAQDTFAVTKVKLGFNFTRTNSDTLTLSGQIPLPDGFTPTGKIARVLIGGLDVSETLSNKGASGDKSFSLRTKKGSSVATFSLLLKNKNLFASLKNLGFSKTQGNTSLDFPVIVVLDGTSHLADTKLAYTVKVNRLGPQSGSGKNN